MRVVGYIRVSTQKQAEDGLGLAVQEAAIKRWAREHRARLVAMTRDNGISGTLPVEERQGLTEALRLVVDSAADALVVLRLDRLARSLSVQEAALAHIWKGGGRVFAVESGEVLQDDPEDPMRTAMRQMMGVFGQLERGMITARLRGGRRLKAERGGFAYGSPPFGYKAERGELVEVPEEQVTLTRIRQLRKAGQSLRGIAAVLESEGRNPRRALRWGPASLRKVLLREAGTRHERRSEPTVKSRRRSG